MFIYEVTRTDNNKRGLISSHFPDLERGATIRHFEYTVRVESKAMSAEEACNRPGAGYLPFLN